MFDQKQKELSVFPEKIPVKGNGWFVSNTDMVKYHPLVTLAQYLVKKLDDKLQERQFELFNTRLTHCPVSPTALDLRHMVFSSGLAAYGGVVLQRFDFIKV